MPPDDGTLLVVDDELFLREAVAASLRFLGFEVTAAQNGTDALRLARNRPFDLLILDVLLPDIDGFEIVRRLRRDGNRVPVIFLTAKDTQDDKVTGLTIGGDDYMTKPFGLEELAARVRTVLRRTRPVPGRTGPVVRRPHPRPGHLRGPPRRARGSTCRRPSSGCCATSCSTPAGCSRAPSCSITYGTMTSADPARSCPPTSPTCGASWPATGRT